MSETFPRAVADYLDKHTTTLADGRIVATNETGTIRYHSDREGCPEWSAKDLADYLQATRSDLWAETATAAPAEPSKPATAMMPDPFKHSQYFTAKPGSLSDLMAKAKAGDAKAMAALKSRMGIA